MIAWMNEQKWMEMKIKIKIKIEKLCRLQNFSCIFSTDICRSPNSHSYLNKQKEKSSLTVVWIACTIEVN